jgi:hypothetical protein
MIENVISKDRIRKQARLDFINNHGIEQCQYHPDSEAFKVWHEEFDLMLRKRLFGPEKSMIDVWVAHKYD